MVQQATREEGPSFTARQESRSSATKLIVITSLDNDDDDGVPKVLYDDLIRLLL